MKLIKVNIKNTSYSNDLKQKYKEKLIKLIIKTNNN